MIRQSAVGKNQGPLAKVKVTCRSPVSYKKMKLLAFIHELWDFNKNDRY
jgi:hypothetical protein